MSVTIFWHPVNPVAIRVTCPQSVLVAFEKVFGSRKPNLDMDSISALRAMSAVFNGDDDLNPYEQLADAIENHGQIQVTCD